MAHSSSAKSVGTLSVRAGVSSKLLARKSAEKTIASNSHDGIEASFPIHAPDLPEVKHPFAGASHGATAPATATAPPLGVARPTAALAWSDEDESCFQALSARRKAARVPRFANSGTQPLQPGTIKPNPNTVVAVIVGIVADRGIIRRGDLVAAMATMTFPHPKARPTDPPWCQGYIAGAIRSGYLALADESGGRPLEHSQSAELDSSITPELERSAVGA